MSQPRTAAAHRDLDPWNGLFYTVADRLTPLFKGDGRGKLYARYAAGEAIAGYHPDSRADYATIGRILALSLATITAAEHASKPGLETDDLVRVLGKVHTLSQAADRAERSMMMRRRQMAEDGVHRDALVPRPSGRPSRYAPLPADEPASGAAREAEEQKAAADVVETPAAGPDRSGVETPSAAVALQAAPTAIEANAGQPEAQPAAALVQADRPPAPIAAKAGLPEAQPAAPARSVGLRLPDPMPAELRTAIHAGHTPAAMAPGLPGFPAVPAGENAAFRPVTAEPSFRQHLLGGSAMPAAEQAKSSSSRTGG